MKKEKFRIFRTILTLCFGVFLMEANAQDIAVRGHVKDASGVPVIGANVTVKDAGKPVGTITDVDGNFVLNAPQNSVLSVTFIGYKPTEVKVAPSVSVTLEEDAQMLDAVVVVGYGTVKKNDLTGSVTAIKPDKISKGITTSAQDMMVGKIAGVNVMANGTPGGGATIRIRGGSSLNANNDPLIVIDGLAMDNSGVKGLTNPLAMVNPNDIETFTVLKDASATAIYGSRASNGVIIITTKKGKAGGRPQVNYDGNVSFGIRQKAIDVMNAAEFKNYVTQLYGEGNEPGEFGEADTNWQDEIFRTAISTDHNVTVSGGLKYMPYRASFGYTNQNGILQTSKFERYTAALNLSPSFFKDYLKFNVNAKMMWANQRYADGGAIGAALTMDPTRPVYDNSEMYQNFGGFYQPSSDGSSYNDPEWPMTIEGNATANPVSLLKLKKHTSRNISFVGNVEIDYKLHFFPDLRLHVNVGGDYSEGKEKNVNSPYAPGSYYYGWVGADYGYKYNFSVNAYAQYTKEIGDHYIDVMVGGEEQHFHYTGFGVGQGTNRLTGEAHNPSLREQTAWGHHSTLVSYFARANYTLLNRYLLTVTFREDGSSRFAKNNRWSSFPSVALGWKIKEESFLRDVTWLSDLKLRLGWGITGQQNLGDDYDFPYMALYRLNAAGGFYPFGDEYFETMRPNAYNPDLKWERTTTYNAGIDFSFLNGRIAGGVDYYYRKTDDLINTVKIAAGTNFNTQLISNIGSLKNSGIEFSINAKPVVTKDFVWDLGYNVTWNDNEITKLTGADNDQYYVETGGVSTGISGATCQVQKVGYPMNSFFVYQQVYDQNGKPIENMYVDRNGNGIIDPDDRYIYKKPAADVLMGLTSKFTYKNWDLSFALRASLNNYVYNDVLASKSNVGKGGIFNHGYYSNRPIDAVNLGFEGIGDYFLSDRFVENASFLRCDNITLGYSFNGLGKTTGYTGVGGRVYATVQNPFVVTKYTGLDPEAGADGIDKNIYPHPVTFLVGLSLQF